MAKLLVADWQAGRHLLSLFPPIWCFFGASMLVVVAVMA
jgi:hypothetical protein